MKKSKMTFEEKLQLLAEAAGKAKPGICHVEIRHENNCPALKTLCLSDCTCSPDVEVLKEC